MAFLRPSRAFVCSTAGRATLQPFYTAYRHERNNTASHFGSSVLNLRRRAFSNSLAGQSVQIKEESSRAVSFAEKTQRDLEEIEGEINKCVLATYESLQDLVNAVIIQVQPSSSHTGPTTQAYAFVLKEMGEKIGSAVRVSEDTIEAVYKLQEIHTEQISQLADFDQSLKAAGNFLQDGIKTQSSIVEEAARRYEQKKQEADEVNANFEALEDKLFQLLEKYHNTGGIFGWWDRNRIKQEVAVEQAKANAALKESAALERTLREEEKTLLKLNGHLDDFKRATAELYNDSEIIRSAEVMCSLAREDTIKIKQLLREMSSRHLVRIHAVSKSGFSTSQLAPICVAIMRIFLLAPHIRDMTSLLQILEHIKQQIAGLPDQVLTGKNDDDYEDTKSVNELLKDADSFVRKMQSFT
ncbi:hypothetical protein H9L39_19143 [Fusarium oxysporum f. sp. albedinis]|nr:hypothetical protein H9L39_19143 [Fusarium oxysporum f. sp. albedinis]